MIGLGVSIAQVAARRRPAVSVSFTLPANNEVVLFGDSRTDMHPTGQDGELGVTAGGTSFTYQLIHPLVWLTSLTGNRITGRSPTSNSSTALGSDAAAVGLIDYGIGGQGTVDMMAIPRGTPNVGTTPVSVAALKGLDKVAAQPAAIVIPWSGTNDSLSSQAPGGATDAAWRNFLDYLSGIPVASMGGTAPLAGGQPKTIIWPNEVGQGRLPDGSIDAGKVKDMKAYANRSLRYDYASGDALARSNVLAVDTYGDPAITDPASGTQYLSFAGSSIDGQHPSPELPLRMAQKIASRLTPLIASMPRIIVAPTPATVSQFNLTSNPLMAGNAGGGTISGTFTKPGGAALTTADIPTGYFLSLSPGAAAVVEVLDGTTFGFDSGIRVMKFTLSGQFTTPTNATLQVWQRITVANVSPGTEKYRGVAKLRLDSGPNSTTLGPGMRLGFSVSDTKYNMTAQITDGASTGGTYRHNRVGVVNGSFDFMEFATPLLDSTLTDASGARMLDGGRTLSASNSRLLVQLGYGPGYVGSAQTGPAVADDVFYVACLGARKM